MFRIPEDSGLLCGSPAHAGVGLGEVANHMRCSNQSTKDVTEYNRQAWDEQVARGNRWTVPVSSADVESARHGKWQVVLTPQQPVPASWFPPMQAARVLGLASGGGQQAPLMAAAGATVTVLDNSPAQLEQDQRVARRDGLRIESVLGDMRDLSMFQDATFDLVFNPCSVSFVPDVLPVFEEVRRVLRPGGRLMCGFINPARFIFDEQELEQGRLAVRHRLPYHDATHLNADELEQLREQAEPLMFSHSLRDLIRGQIQAGLVLDDLYEDIAPDEALSEYLPVYFATLASKPN